METPDNSTTTTFVGVPIISAEDKARADAREARQKQLADNYPTLRDQFAMAAIPGLIGATEGSWDIIATAAYDVADAMLKARKGS